ncbi:VCBS repeat-containing protein, partial [Sphingomonas sp. DG1-23]|uniref:FG-GAP repeat domain-containing protein n=1 Tax=Sphingomonas sp. DG1-23 TaxID=3068316 RepID=UPI00273D9380
MPDATQPEFLSPVYYPTGSSGTSPTENVAGGDFDNDGDIDLLAATYDSGSHNGFVALLENTGNGSFTAPAKMSGDWQAGPNILVADLNGDGNLDCFVVKPVFNGPEPSASLSDFYLYYGDGAGGFAFRRNTNTPGVIAATILKDVNGDGRLDLITTRRIWSDPATSQPLFAVELGQADGEFGNARTKVLPAGGNGIASGHLNDDAFMDLVVTTASGYSLLLGNGDGTFAETNVAVAGGTTSPAVADFNGDGIDDLAIGVPAAAQFSILRGNGSGGFAPAGSLATRGTPREIAVQDLNGDGIVDIVTKSGSGQVSYFINDGEAASQPRVDLLTGFVSGLAVLDLNGDGALDIASPGGSPTGLLVALQRNLDNRPFTPDDFDGDGKSDILWRHDDGRSHIWEMNGTTQVGGGNTSAQLSSDWTIQGTGDFDGDGKTDLLWRSAAGESRVWTLDGTTVLSQAATNSQAPTAWKVQDVADFNGDGKADILWRHDSGTTNIWLMDGGTQ